MRTLHATAGWFRRSACAALHETMSLLKIALLVQMPPALLDGALEAFARCGDRPTIA
jgi:hypothetical protein